MIDIFKDIYNNLNIALQEWAETAEGQALLETRTIKLDTSYPETSDTFPLVILEEKNNMPSEKTRELDEVETTSNLLYEVNIYDNTQTPSTKKIDICRAIMLVIDNFFNTQRVQNMYFKRLMCEPIPNIADAQVYRIVMRYKNI